MGGTLPVLRDIFRPENRRSNANFEPGMFLCPHRLRNGQIRMSVSRSPWLGERAHLLWETRYLGSQFSGRRNREDARFRMVLSRNFAVH